MTALSTREPQPHGRPAKGSSLAPQDGQGRAAPRNLDLGAPSCRRLGSGELQTKARSGPTLLALFCFFFFESEFCQMLFLYRYNHMFFSYF